MTLSFLLIPFLEYLVPTALLLGLVLLLMRRKITPDLLIAWIAPICFWTVLMFFTERGTLSNYVLEPLLLAAVIVLLMLVRLVLGSRGVVDERVLVRWTPAVLLLSTACIVFLTPPLPE